MPWKITRNRVLFDAERNPVSSSALAIYDDIFPYGVSGFRLTEFEYYLRNLPLSQIYTSLTSLRIFGMDENRNEILSQWTRTNIDIASRLSIIDSTRQLPDASCFYSIFLNNALAILGPVEQRRGLFSFTLYPGGGFRFGNRGTDKRLRRVVNSPSFYKVIVTQPSVLEYILEKDIIDHDKILYVFGGVQAQRLDVLKNHQISPDAPLKLGFVANRYHRSGLDKGLDIFSGAAKDLIACGERIECHFIGPWNADDLADDELVVHSRFHGSIHNQDLQTLLEGLDICVFPTREGALGPGTFDGFPVGAAVEAGLAGCVVLTTNPLKQPSPLVDGRDYIEISAQVNDVVARVRELINTPSLILELQSNARRAFGDVYSERNQLAPRLELLEGMLDAACGRKG